MASSTSTEGEPLHPPLSYQRWTVIAPAQLGSLRAQLRELASLRALPKVRGRIVPVVGGRGDTSPPVARRSGQQMDCSQPLDPDAPGSLCYRWHRYSTSGRDRAPGGRRAAAVAPPTPETSCLRAERSRGMPGWGGGRERQEQRGHHREARRAGGDARARFRVRSEHVAPGGSGPGRGRIAWSCSTTSARAAPISSAWRPERYATLDGYAARRAGDLPGAGPARCGVRRALGQRDDRGARRDRGAGRGSPSSCCSPRRRATSTTATTGAGSAAPTSTSCWSRSTATTSAGRRRWLR